MIENTAATYPLIPGRIHGRIGMTNTEFIEGMEAEGQRQLLTAEVIPTRMGDRTAYEALGFVFGDTVAGDPMFIQCTLPAGWTKQGSDHAMWSYIHDQIGRRRVAIFYKAAFYDRDAFARLETPHGYLYRLLGETSAPVLDGTWLTVEIAARELEAIAETYDKGAADARGYGARDANRNQYWAERAAEDEDSARAARALRDSITGEPQS